MKEAIINFKAFKKRSAAHITLKYENLTQDDINNIKRRLERTLKNFDTLWTSCEGIPDPIKKREIRIKIVIFDERGERFISRGCYGYTHNRKRVILTKDVKAVAYKNEKYLAVCCLYRANKEGPAEIRAVEHEFGHALTRYWTGTKISKVSTYFSEGSADLIAHGGSVCLYLKKNLEELNKQDDLSLEAIKIIGSKSERESYKALYPSFYKSKFYKLPHIKLAYLRNKDPQLFGKLVDYLMNSNTEGAETLNKKFSKENNELFKEWVKKHQGIRSEDPDYLHCMVNFYGAIFDQSKTQSEKKGCDLEQLFSNEQARKILGIWNISTIEALHEKTTFSDEKAIRCFMSNIEEAIGTTHLKYVLETCGLEAMLSDQTHYLKELKEWKDYLLKEIKPKKKSAAYQLLCRVSNVEEGTIFTLLKTCGLLEGCTTFYDFSCFCKAVESILRDEEICTKIIDSEDCNEAFRQVASPL